MAVPSSYRKMEVVVVQHVMEESEKPVTPDGVEIRHLPQKIVIPGRPYRESRTAQTSEVLLFAKLLLSAFRAPQSSSSYDTLGDLLTDRDRSPLDAPSPRLLVP